MTTVNDIGEEMLKVQRQITFLKSKTQENKRGRRRDIYLEPLLQHFVHRLHGQNKLTQ